MIYDQNEIVAFWKPNEENGIYSQWYMVPITLDGITYCCCEQYMMYMKAVLFNDIDTANKILQSANPAEMKRLGRFVKHFDKTVWDKHKRQIVFSANYAKFTQNKDLHDALLATRDKLIIEASPKDYIWGIGLPATSNYLLDSDHWPGLNLLGKIIMQVREQIRTR